MEKFIENNNLNVPKKVELTEMKRWSRQLWQD
jgi:hypothetical protein